MTPLTEIAWAAGFFDGEGWIRLNGPDSAHMYPMIGIAQVEREPLDRFMSALGYGQVRARKMRPSRVNQLWRPQFEYVCTRWSHTHIIMALLWPYLSEFRKDQARSVFAEWEKLRAANPRLGTYPHTKRKGVVPA